MSYQQLLKQQPAFMVYPKRKSTMNDDACMYMRISYEFQSKEKSLGIKIDFKNWDSQAGEIIGLLVHAHQLKEKVKEYEQKIMGSYYMLTKHGASSTLTEILDIAFNEDGQQQYSLFGVFNDTILKLEKQLKPGDSVANLGKHRACYKHLKNYLKTTFKANDIGFSRINRSFIDNFEYYLKAEGKNEHNSAMKMMQIFKKIYKIALDNHWTAVNAFAGKRISFKDVEMPYLTKDEIALLETFEFKNERLAFVRDLFAFCCYTGLAYVDLKTLQRKHIEYSPASKQSFIKKKRQKTKQPFIIPLFPPAYKILTKRVTTWESLSPETFLFSVMSNQKYNDYLKEVAAHCGIEKNMTTHLARHSFATTIALENGVSLESTSKMLGHSKISQTQKYAKVTEMKIEKETRDLFLQLS